MATFALVHGGYHGPWCWERLTPFLQQAGHHVVTMDLPLEDSTATFDTYADVVCAALDDRATTLWWSATPMPETPFPWSPRADRYDTWSISAR